PRGARSTPADPAGPTAGRVRGYPDRPPPHHPYAPPPARLRATRTTCPGPGPPHRFPGPMED
ncbi:hypothetical protein ACFXOL_33480, partial [Streptomyces californicus]